MSVAKISASWVATESGIWASSVAAKSDVRTVPLASSDCEASGASAVEATSLSAMRSIRRRVNWVGILSLPGAAKRATSSSRRPEASARTRTILLPRPSRSLRATGSLRRNAAAAASPTPSRASSESAVSLALVTSLRKSSRSLASMASIWARRSAGTMLSVTIRCGRSATSGTIGATPNAVAAKPARPSETALASVLG